MGNTQARVEPEPPQVTFTDKEIESLSSNVYDIYYGYRPISDDLWEKYELAGGVREVVLAMQCIQLHGAREGQSSWHLAIYKNGKWKVIGEPLQNTLFVIYLNTKGLLDPKEEARAQQSAINMLTPIVRRPTHQPTFVNLRFNEVHVDFNRFRRAMVRDCHVTLCPVDCWKAEDFLSYTRVVSVLYDGFKELDLPSRGEDVRWKELKAASKK